MKKEAEVKRKAFMKERVEGQEWTGVGGQEKRVLCELLSRQGRLKATPLKAKPREAIEETAPWRKKEESTNKDTTIE